MDNNSKKVLIGAKSIMAYLELSRPMFHKFVEMGMPATVIGKRWYAHTDNLDDFFRKLTFVRVREIPPDAE